MLNRICLSFLLKALGNRHFDVIPVIDRKCATIVKRHVFMHVKTGYIAQEKLKSNNLLGPCYIGLPCFPSLSTSIIDGKYSQKFVNGSQHFEITFLSISNLYFMLSFFSPLLFTLKSSF